MQTNITTNPGIYIHIPFCERKCVYCDFYSLTDRSSQNTFVETLLFELEQNAHLGKNDIFDTIYLGGGTPSLLSIDELTRIFEKIHKLYNISANVETTIEVNPGTVDLLKLRAYKKIGINRLSIGIQSFNDDDLRFLGRIHNAQQAGETIRAGRSAGFDNISLDLISAIPGQTIDNWFYNLQEVIKYHPEHISAYTLIIEDGTPLHEKVLKEIVTEKPPDEEAEFFEKTIDTLKKNNYLHYEVSSFSKNEEYISRHNFKYWNHSNYLGFGPSARSFWNRRRYKNVASLTEYIKKLSAAESAEIFSENLNDAAMEFEYIFLNLRTFSGIDFADFKKRFGHIFIESYNSSIKSLIANGFAEIDNNIFRLTKKGLMLSDEILPGFAK
jgi:oxygen-independent coproporphyrinogen-3 oxidase